MIPLAATVDRQDCPEAYPGIDQREHEPHDWHDVDGVLWRCFGLAS